MKYLLLSILYDLNKERALGKLNKGILQVACNTFQGNLLKGFFKEDISVLNALSCGAFPLSCKKLFFKKNRWEFDGKITVNDLGFVNLPLIKQYVRARSFYKQSVKWIKNTEGEKTIIVYSLYLPFEKAIKRISKKYPNVKTAVICTDLPCEYGVLSKNKAKAFLQNANGKKVLKNSKYFSHYILLTEQMKYPLQIGAKPYFIMEGIANATMQCKSDYVSDQKIILYTGSLNSEFGVLNLIEAFKLIKDDDYNLWICGVGNAEKQVKEQSEIDKRIKFFGLVSKQQVCEMQLKATVLVNPRTNGGEYTKYSFPSKTMEYMASGVPVLMFKLDGIPNEYDKYLTYFTGESAEQMASDIVNMCSKPSDKQREIGEKARRFVIDEKSSEKQVEKMKGFLENN